jgi:site-specific DNA recombinase
VCGNTLRRPVAGVDAAVVEWIEANVLNEEIVAAVLVEVRQRLAARTEAPNAERDELEAEAKRLRAEIDRLVMALASGAESPTIASAVNDREKRLSDVRARLEVLQVAPAVLDLEVRRLEREARTRLSDLRGLLGRNVAEGRKTLESLLTGPLTFRAVEKDDARRYLVEGAAGIGPIFTTESVPKGIRNQI